MDWWTDPRMLAAGNARGIPAVPSRFPNDPAARTAGDPDFPVSDISGAVAGSSYTDPVVRVADLATLSGDMDAHAERLGIPVADLVAAVRSHRARSPIARLFSAMGRWAR